MKKLNSFFGSRTKRKKRSEIFYPPVPLLIFGRDIYPECVDQKNLATASKGLMMIVFHAGQCKAILKRTGKRRRQPVMRSMKVVGEKTFIHFSCPSRIAFIFYSHDEAEFIFRKCWARWPKPSTCFCPPVPLLFPERDIYSGCEDRKKAAMEPNPIVNTHALRLFAHPL